MITRNFKHLLAEALPSISTSSVRIGTLPVRTVSGITYYLCNHAYRFPFGVSFSATYDANTTGISVGTGGTPPTEFDCNLENTLSEGINLTLTQAVPGMDGDSSYVDLHLTAVNTSDAPITIREIGYKQAALTTARPLATTTVNSVILIDRTVLDTPLVLQPNDAGVIEYKLQTNPMGPKYKEGIKLVSWTYGTDEEIVTLINAARQGIIDLQADAGWSVSDVREIDVGGWTDGAGTEYAPSKMMIAISQFGDYNSCGCLFQYDFVSGYGGIRMNATNTTVGGYKESEMRTISIPSLFQALPAWLQLLSKEFSVLASKGGNEGSTIETVTGNKLALRSEIEVFGTISNSYPGEGSWIDLYKLTTFRSKIGVSDARHWWERSVSIAGTTRDYCMVDSAGSSTHTAASNTKSGVFNISVSPFGCI